MKRSLLLVFLISLLLTACTPPEVDCARSDVYCVGLVTDTGGLQDYGLTQSAWEGIQKALADGIIQKADYIESVSALDYAKNLSTFAEMKYDLIVASGVSLEDETIQAADQYSDSVFIGLDQASDPSRQNLLVVNFPQDKGGFLAGALAASMTDTGVIGAACETSGIASNWSACEGFRAGAAYIDPEVTVLVTYREDGHREDLFRDQAWGRETALEMLADGVDVLFGVGGGTGQGAVVAAAQAGAWSIGSEQDQFEVRPEAGKRILASVIPDAGSVLYAVLAQIPSGLPTSPLMGSMRLSPFHEAERFIMLPVQQNLIELENALKNGGISTGVKPEEAQ